MDFGMGPLNGRALALASALFVLAICIAAWGFARRFAAVKRVGGACRATSSRKRSLGALLIDGVLQRRVLRDPVEAVVHLFVSVGMGMLLLFHLVLALRVLFGFELWGGLLRDVMTEACTAAGLAIVAGLVVAVIRRWVIRPAHVHTARRDAVALALVGLPVAAGLLYRLLVGFVEVPLSGYLAVFSDGGAAVRAVLVGVSPSSIRVGLLETATALWWAHAVAGAVFVASLPFSKLAHTVLAPVNIALDPCKETGVADPIDFEDEQAENFGKNSLAELDRQVALGAEACVQCGRCEERCPAYASGKSLNPLSTQHALRRAAAADDAALSKGEGCSVLVDSVANENAVWACTTCRSCEEGCPVHVGHVDTLVEMRRWLTLTEGRVPTEAQQAFRGFETTGNPWGLNAATRLDHARSLKVPGVSECEQPEVVLWPGCMGSFDPRGQSVTEALVALLRAADVRFAVVDGGVQCCGDSARRLGNEYLFEMLARQNVELLNAAKIARIVTTCPHCLHVLGKEYPQYGGEYEVLHHSEYLEELVLAGRLSVSDASEDGSDATSSSCTAAYHDPCYLGRYRGQYNAPRRLLAAAGIRLAQVAHSREDSLCCGAGGGRMWLEEEQGKHVNHLRAFDLLGCGADCVAVACPFCASMLRDGVEACLEGDMKVEVKDVAELLAERLPNRRK